MSEGVDTDLKAESAFQAVLRAGQTVIPAASILTSFSDQTQVTGENWVSCVSQGGREDGNDSGNERLTLSIQVHSLSQIDPDEEDPGDRFTAHCVNCRAIFGLIKTTTLAADLSAAIADFTVFPGIIFKRGRNRLEKEKFVSEVLIEFSCAPSDIA